VVWSQTQADNEFNRRYGIARSQALAAIGVLSYDDEVRLAAATDMAYQLGGNGLAEFHNMLAAFRTEDWQTAHDECLNSDYAKQTPNRAVHNASIFLTGEWP